MINKILIGIFKVITKLISVLLAPINLLITNMLPNFNSMLSIVGNFFSQVGTYTGYVLDSLLISNEVVSFLILYWVFKLTFPFLVYSIKLIIKWYDKLKV